MILSKFSDLIKFCFFLFTCIISRNPNLTNVFKSDLAVKLETLNLVSISLLLNTLSGSPFISLII